MHCFTVLQRDAMFYNFFAYFAPLWMALHVIALLYHFTKFRQRDHCSKMGVTPPTAAKMDSCLHTKLLWVSVRGSVK